MNAFHLPLLIITGSAPCVIDDLTALALDDSAADFMAVGLDAVDKYPWRIKYVVTYHPDEIPQFKPRRAKAGGNTDFLVISHIKQTEKGDPYAVDIVEPYQAPTGSSSLCGALAGIRLGYDRIVLCGCPLDVKPYLVFQAGWTAKLKEVAGRVRSMSGWTKDLLGEPTEEWLNGGE